MTKLKVVPVLIPWMISPSFDFFSFVGDDEGNVSVKVICNFNQKIRNEKILMLRQQYGENIPDEEYNKAGSSMIRINFYPRYLFNIYSKVNGYERYDFSIFDKYYFGGASIDDEWNNTGICPNPGFYEVVEPKLKEMFGFTSPKVKHWLLCGHDSFIDILACSFEWEEVDF